MEQRSEALCLALGFAANERRGGGHKSMIPDILQTKSCIIKKHETGSDPTPYLVRI
jgi:hypothetical protein